MADGTRARSRLVFPPRSWRATNLALLAGLVLAFATGVGAVATGSPRGAWIAVAHGVVGVTVVLLVPAKRRVAAGGLRRRRPGRWVSVALAGLALGSLASGFASATGVLRVVAGQTALWVHIALALLLVPLLGRHVAARPVRPAAGRPHPADAGAGRAAGRRRGRALRRGGGRPAGSSTLPGAGRRFTGSYPVEPSRTPVTSWLDDAGAVGRRDRLAAWA